MATIRRGNSLGKASVINAVVFDMDGVLCRYRIERRLALLASWSGQSPDAIHAAIWRSGFEDEAERGVVSADEYLLGFGERMCYPLSAAQWVEARRAAIEPDLAVLSLAQQLSTDHPVGMFTNNPLLLKRHIAEVFPAVASAPAALRVRVGQIASWDGGHEGATAAEGRSCCLSSFFPGADIRWGLGYMMNLQAGPNVHPTSRPR